MYRILIVDDERIERSGIKFLLKQVEYEFEVDEAVNGEEALKKFEEKEYDILLTDVRMPFMDGIELLENIKKKNINIRTVIFSGCNEFEYAKNAIRLGVEDYILKPVDPKEFANTINKVVLSLENEKIESEMKNKTRAYINEHVLFLLLNGTTTSQIEQMYKGLDVLSYAASFKRMFLVEFKQEFFGKNNIDNSDGILGDSTVSAKYINLNQQQAIVFFDYDTDYVKVAKHLYEFVKDKYDAECFISLSKELQGPEDILPALEGMENLMENRFFHPEIHVFYENMEQGSDSIINLDDDTLIKQMKQDIKMKDIDSIREHFERFCSKYRTKTGYSQIYIKFLFSNLLKDIYSNLDSDDLTLNKEIEKLYLVADFDSVAEIVNKGISQLDKKFKDCENGGHKEVEVVKNYIYHNFGTEISIDKLADMVYMAPGYLSTVFKKETGQNLSKFIKEYRMERAKDMLENSLAKIVDISNQCGYPNVSYFCSSFRDFYGVSPQKFRENGGEIQDEK